MSNRNDVYDYGFDPEEHAVCPICNGKHDEESRLIYLDSEKQEIAYLFNDGTIFDESRISENLTNDEHDRIICNVEGCNFNVSYDEYEAIINKEA